MQDALMAGLASGRQHQNAKPLGASVLVTFVETNLPFPGVAFLATENRLRCIVEFNEEVQDSVPVAKLQDHVGTLDMLTEAEPGVILAVKAQQRYAFLMSRDERMDEKIRE